MKDYDDNFPKLTHYERVSSNFNGNEIVGCASSFIILTETIDDADCNKLGSYNGTFTYQNNENIDVTLKAEKIQKDDIPKDSGHIKKVAILISIITLILLYYLLLL